MPRLPARFAGLIIAFAPLFVHRSWRLAQVLLISAVMAPGQRTVASLLQITGLSRERHFVNYHRILSRAAWSPRSGARILLGLLVDAFVQDGPLVMAIDDTIERRRGRRIKAKGIYRDPVRSSDAHFVKTSGLRWMSLMLLAPVPWAGRIWALPVLTALAPSERFCRERGRRHKTLLGWGRQMALQVRRWLPGRDLILVTDSGFSALLFLDAMRRAGITAITRLRLDAALYEPAPIRLPGTLGRPRRKGSRLPTLAEVLATEGTSWQTVQVLGWYGAGERTIEITSATAVWQHGGLPVVPIRWVLIRDPLNRFAPQALLCTDPTRDPVQIVSWFVRRWQVEVTFQEARTHLGLETQRQWSDRAIARTTPCLLALFSIVTLMAGRLPARERRRVAEAAWYRKPQPTFSDALAAVRRAIWREQVFVTSRRKIYSTKLRNTLPDAWAHALCYAA
ncbi:MAG TPA: transposase [Lacipirellulaceae bacterium]|nr:transposase [Lacipirellulaceae bacterium]